MAKQYYGGQAVIEGVMMRGRNVAAIAVRNPAGEIVIHQEPLTAAVYTKRWATWPVVRGMTMLWDASGAGHPFADVVSRCGSQRGGGCRVLRPGGLDHGGSLADRSHGGVLHDTGRCQQVHRNPLRR